jgi:hypothetical protein
VPPAIFPPIGEIEVRVNDLAPRYDLEGGEQAVKQRARAEI